MDGDGLVTWRDAVAVLQAIRSGNQDPRFDVSGDGRVGWGDVWTTLTQLGQRCQGGVPPSSTPTKTPVAATKTPTTVPATKTPTLLPATKTPSPVPPTKTATHTPTELPD